MVTAYWSVISMLSAGLITMQPVMADSIFDRIRSIVTDLYGQIVAISTIVAVTVAKLKNFFEMNDETADRFMGCFAKFSPESIKNEYYTDLLTWLRDDIHVEGTKVHFIYANKMGEKYLKRYKKYFRDPEIREFDMQHEQWLFGGEQYTAPVLKAIDEFMELTAK